MAETAISYKAAFPANQTDANDNTLNSKTSVRSFGSPPPITVENPMHTPNSAATLATIYSHRSIRAYSGAPIAPDTLAAILEAGRAASSSSFMQNTHIIRITDPAMRQTFAAIAKNQQHIIDAAEFLVFCTDYHKHHLTSADLQTDWTEALLIGAIDAGICAQNCLLAAESLGLGGVFIGALRNDIARVAELLRLPAHTAPLFGLCLGHPAQNPQQRPRMPLAMTVSENTYTAPDAQAIAAYNQTIAAYYQTRGQTLDWQQSVSKTLGKPLRPHILPFLHQQGLAKR